MKLVSRIAAMAIALAAATPAFAQDRTGGGKLGVGVGISNGGILDTLLLVPINITPQFRIEPFVGTARIDIDEAPAAAPVVDHFDAQGKRSDFTLGVGGFALVPVVSQVQLYGGLRLGLNWQSDKQAGAAADKWTRRSTIVGIAAGGEYLPHPRVAVGAEIMVAHAFIGDTEFTDGGTGLKFEGSGGSADQTQGTLFVRVYIF